VDIFVFAGFHHRNVMSSSKICLKIHFFSDLGICLTSGIVSLKIKCQWPYGNKKLESEFGTGISRYQNAFRNVAT